MALIIPAVFLASYVIVRLIFAAAKAGEERKAVNDRIEAVEKQLADAADLAKPEHTASRDVTQTKVMTSSGEVITLNYDNLTGEVKVEDEDGNPKPSLQTISRDVKK